MNYVVAVSGGVDSVVLLDMLAKQQKHNLVVAHFDHGIRSDSDADARFAWELAKNYQLPFEVRREELGPNASELTARNKRYEFLREMAQKYNARIVTAHHADDVVESIAINLTRGTGWRGLTVMSDENIVRPLIGLKKRQIYAYALRYELEFVEDETNHDHSYLRNKIRSALAELSESSHRQLIEQRAVQQTLRRAIQYEVDRYTNRTDRYFFIMIPEMVALEVLRSMTASKLTMPQLRVLLGHIKVARSGTKIEAGANTTVEMTRTTFAIEQK